jgi:hypothetical protein
MVRSQWVVAGDELHSGMSGFGDKEAEIFLPRNRWDAPDNRHSTV